MEMFSYEITSAPRSRHKERTFFQIQMLHMYCTHSEVVEGGVRQATSCYVFGQLVQHLRVLGLEHMERRLES